MHQICCASNSLCQRLILGLNAGGGFEPEPEPELQEEELGAESPPIVEREIYRPQDPNWMAQVQLLYLLLLSESIALQ